MDKIKLVPVTPKSLAQQERDIAATTHSPTPAFTKDWFEKMIDAESEICEVAPSQQPSPEYANAKALAGELNHENLSTLTLIDLKVLWEKLFAAMKADGCTGFHATPNMDALDKLPSDHERERHWLIGVMEMLGASLRGEYEDVTETLS